MSLNGKAENCIEICGSISLPDVIHGKSAYELAVYHGFDGTEEEWIASLKGENGSKIISTVLVGQDENGNNIYRQTFDNGFSNDFVAPKGDEGKKGDKGDKGDAGVIRFIVVNELPTENIDGGAIYLIPSTDAESDNAFDEFIYVDGNWEQIGSASVAVNLDEYVKKTDIASDTAAGVVKIGTGLKNINGAISIDYASEVAITKKAGYRYPLVPQFLDLVVKTGITTNTIALTDEEKAAALAWLGLGDLVARIEALEEGNKTIIPFMFNDGMNATTLSAEEGMTWRQWVVSKYNTVGFAIDGNTVVTSDGVWIYYNVVDYTLALPDDIIEAEHWYGRLG